MDIMMAFIYIYIYIYHVLEHQWLYIHIYIYIYYYILMFWTLMPSIKLDIMCSCSNTHFLDVYNTLVQTWLEYQMSVFPTQYI